LLLATTESRNARAKLKIQGYLAKTTQPAWQVLCFFLACSRKTVAKALDFAKKKKKMDCFVISFLAMTEKCNHHIILFITRKVRFWIPACAGMTEGHYIYDKSMNYFACNDKSGGFSKFKFIA
jgi:hypothetical protein